MSKKVQPSKKDDDATPGYPAYPASDDIYANETEVPLNTTGLPVGTEATPETGWNEKDYTNEVSGDDLDVPGAELEENGVEQPGSEDEENEYFSLGGDDHDDLDEE